ncbi:MAG: hypothetical protein WC717_06475 [Candidatus Micrarchaeia archaeon]|jgi:hypothetical protein
MQAGNGALRLHRGDSIRVLPANGTRCEKKIAKRTISAFDRCLLLASGGETCQGKEPACSITIECMRQRGFFEVHVPGGFGKEAELICRAISEKFRGSGAGRSGWRMYAGSEPLSAGQEQGSGMFSIRLKLGRIGCNDPEIYAWGICSAICRIGNYP